MEMSLEDLQLIHALQLAPRAPWAALGEVLGRHPTRLAAAWQRLTDSGAAWVMGHEQPDPGRSLTAFVELTLAPGSFATAIPWLCRLPQVASVEEGVLDADVRLTILTDTYEHFATDLLATLRADSRVVRIRSAIATRAFATGTVWRLDVLEPTQERALMALGPAAGIATGAPSGRGTPRGFTELMTVLRRDGRAPVSELAEAMGVHPATASRRLQQALQERLIAYRADMALYDSGHPVLCQWYVRVPPQRMEAVYAFLTNYRTLRLCMAVTGDANMTFTLWLRHAGEVHQLEQALLDQVPETLLLHTDVGIRMHKRMGHMIGADSRATGEVIGW